MLAFLVLGVVGLVLLALALLVGDLLEGVFEGVGPDWLSGAAVSGFVSAFGFGGALALQAGATVPGAVLAGLLAGAAVGALVAWLTRILTRSGDDSTPTGAHLQGATATVIFPVPAGGLGTVSLTVAGHVTRLNARADAELPAGTIVRVVSVLSPTSVLVEPTPGAAPDTATPHS